MLQWVFLLFLFLFLLWFFCVFFFCFGFSARGLGLGRSKISSDCNKFRVSLYSSLLFVFRYSQSVLHERFLYSFAPTVQFTYCASAGRGRGRQGSGKDACRMEIAGCGSLSSFAAVRNEVKPTSFCGFARLASHTYY